MFNLRYGNIKEYLDNHRIKFHIYKERLSQDDIIAFNSSLSIEEYVSFGRGNYLCTQGAFSYSCSPVLPDLVIGRYSSIARGLEFFGGGHPVDHVSLSPFTYLPTKNSLLVTPYIDNGVKWQNSIFKGKGGAEGVVIGNDCWIGQNVTIKYGCKIGDGAIVAANSLVTKDVPPYAVVGGVPAKIIKFRFSEQIIETLRTIKWWDYNVTDLNGLPFEDPNKFIEAFLIRVKSLEKYKPPVITATDLLTEYYKNTFNLKLAEEVRTHIRFDYYFDNYGWINGCANDAQVDMDRELKAVRVIVDNNFISVDYSVLISDTWFEESSINDSFAGSANKNLSIAGIKIKCGQRKIFYRIKDSKLGWSKVHSNGAPALASSGKIVGIHIAVV